MLTLFDDIIYLVVLGRFSLGTNLDHLLSGFIKLFFPLLEWDSFIGAKKGEDIW